MPVGKYRTFVTLEPHERWILRMVQAGIVMAGNRKPALGKLIGIILRAYWDDFEKNANPELLMKLKKKVPPPAIH
jgi:hypothetical protein